MCIATATHTVSTPKPPRTLVYSLLLHYMQLHIALALCVLQQLPIQYQHPNHLEQSYNITKKKKPAIDTVATLPQQIPHPKTSQNTLITCDRRTMKLCRGFCTQALNWRMCNTFKNKMPERIRELEMSWTSKQQH